MSDVPKMRTVTRVSYEWHIPTPCLTDVFTKAIQYAEADMDRNGFDLTKGDAYRVEVRDDAIVLVVYTNEGSVTTG